ncbi:integrase [Deinococcus taklimakanensis]|uniref:Integrase n=1 Tax=Deinococcus taklimakanensis TaxID=536443 RepID=A0ABW5P1J2_9DEIO
MTEPGTWTVEPPTVLLPSRPRRQRVQAQSHTEQLFYRANGSLHRELSLIHRRLLRRVTEQTANLYCRDFLRFEVYIQTTHGLGWDAPPQVIRQVAQHYLRNHGAHLTKRSDEWLVFPEHNNPHSSVEGRQNLRLVLESLRAVYGVAMRLGLYRHPEDPFTKEFTRDVAAQRPAPQPPSWSGLSRPPINRKQPSHYFVFRGGYWNPAHLIDPMGLYERVTAAFEQPDLPLRDRLITRILFEGGPRVSEACALTVQGWAYALPGTSPFSRSFKLPNKGQGDRARKPVHVSVDTGMLLRQYFVTERRALDPLTGEFSAWCESMGAEESPEQYQAFLRATGRTMMPVPVFLNHSGRPYTANAFRKGAWRPRLAAAGLAARPHQARHWFVTTYLQAIELMFQGQPEEYYRHRQALGQYMGWAFPDRMLQIYDQTLSDQRVHGRLADVSAWLQRLHAQGQFAAVLSTPRPTGPQTQPGPLARRVAHLNQGVLQ